MSLIVLEGALCIGGLELRSGAPLSCNFFRIVSKAKAIALNSGIYDSS